MDEEMDYDIDGSVHRSYSDDDDEYYCLNLDRDSD